MATRPIALPEGVAAGSSRWYRRVPVVTWPLTLYFVGVVVELLWSYRLAAHHFIYPLDDTYIHMAIAKNFALHGVWGVTRFGFSSSSSSLLFDLLIAAIYLVTGPKAWVPLAISLTGGALGIIATDRMLPRDKKLRLAALIALVMFTPLFCTAAIGMEHTLHILLTLAFAWRAARVIHEKRAWDWPLLVLAALVVMARYEGLFLVAAAVLLLLIRRSLKLAAASVAAAWAPITAFGLISMHFGWSFFPNSVLIKGAHYHTVFGPLLHAAVLVLQDPSLLASLLALLLVAVFLLAGTKGEPWSLPRILLWLFVLTLVQHLCMASVGWLFRYEAYLVAFAVLAIADALPLAQIRVFGAMWLLLATTMLALSVRTVRAVIDGPEMSEAIYSQQYQMARFVTLNFPGSPIGLNDIGLIDFGTDIHLLDLTGLANRTIGDSIERNAYTTAVMRDAALGDGTRIAIVYSSWFSAKTGDASHFPLPSSWRCEGQWYSTDPRLLGRKMVTFYAVRPEYATRLAGDLREFARQLPRQTLFFPCH